jgi:hypothetical protein
VHLFTENFSLCCGFSVQFLLIFAPFSTQVLSGSGIHRHVFLSWSRVYYCSDRFVILTHKAIDVVLLYWANSLEGVNGSNVYLVFSAQRVKPKRV